MNPTEFTIHPVAEIFPLNQSDIDTIAEDIKANGQLVPIKITPDGEIVDGRNRWAACLKLGVEPDVEVVEGTDLELLQMSISLNSARRDLKPAQRAAAAAEAIHRFYEEEGEQRGRGKKGSKKTALGGLFSVGKRQLDQALTLLRNARDLFEELKAGFFLVDGQEKAASVAGQYDRYKVRVARESLERKRAEEAEEQSKRDTALLEDQGLLDAEELTPEERVERMKEAMEKARQQEEDRRRTEESERQTRELCWKAITAASAMSHCDFETLEAAIVENAERSDWERISERLAVASELIKSAATIKL